MSERVAFGVDVTTRGASLAMVRDGQIKRGFIPAQADDGLAHTPYSTWHRCADLAARTYAKIVQTGERPTLVLCAKNIWSDMTHDASAFRRAMIWSLLLDKLHRERIPVGEFPLPTLLAWLDGESHAGRGRGVMSLLDAAVERQWHVPPLHGTSASGESFAYPFRQSTIALAMASAMAVGIETDLPVTQRRLNVLSGYANEEATTRCNKSINFPARRKPPRTLAAWHELAANPDLLLRDIDKESATLESENTILTSESSVA